MLGKENASFSLLGLIIWLLASFFFLYEFFLRTFVGTIANQIMHDLALSPEMFALLGSAYYFAYALMQVPVGILTDKFGVRRILIFAILVCVISAFLFANAASFSQAFISRMMMGFGSSFAFVCLLVIAATWFPRKYFGFFVGASQFIGTMGPLLAAGPLAAVLVKSNGDWRTLLADIGIIGGILALLIFLFVKNKTQNREQILIFLKQKTPLIVNLKRLMQNPQAWAIAFYSALVYTSMALLGAIWGTTYLEACGLSQATASHMISLSWLGYAIGCLLLGAISDIAKRRRPVLIISAIIGIVTTIGITYFSVHSPFIYALLFFWLGIAAAGQSVAFAAIAEHVDLATKATALGLNNGTITLFSTFTPLITGLLISLSGKTHGAHLVPHDFTAGFSVMPLMYLLSLLISVFFIRETYCKPQKEPVYVKIDSLLKQSA